MPGFEVFGNEERKQVNDVLESGILMRYGFDGMRNNHWKAKEFETNFAQRMQSQYCQLVSSGTSALTTALASAGIGAGDEVIMPVFTFVASFESILALGAIRKVPAVIETSEGDFIGIRYKMFMSHSYDHRVVNGALGGQFVKAVKDYLEAWDSNREI